MRYGTILSALLVSQSLLQAGDWTQFRGNDGRGSSDDTGLPIKWSLTENLRWKVDLPGRGLSCPIIAGGRVYVTACSEPNQERVHVLAFEETTGKRLWERQFWSTGNTMCHPKTCMAAPTPVTDGQHVYALFGTGDLIALDTEGNLLWYRALVRDYPTVGNNLGLAASPLLWKDVLILPLENVGESFVAGLDKLTGRNRWKVERARDIIWVTPLLFTNGGREEVLVQSQKELTAYDPATGRKLWHHAGSLANASSPTAGNGLVLAPGGDLIALRPGTEKAPPQVAWQSNKLRSSYASPLYYQERVYAVNSANVLNCVDVASGKLIWDLRVKGPFSASPVAADGKIYLVNEEGTTQVVQLGAEPKLLAANALKETILATPAIAGGALYLRSDQHLFCCAEKKTK